LHAIAPYASEVRTVCIGGINASTVQRVLYQSSSSLKKLDGVAIVSGIIAASDPRQAAQELKKLVDGPPPFAAQSLKNLSKALSVDDVVKEVPSVVKAVGERTPLSHNMTNLVVQNFAANVALAVGASPIMANYGKEAQDLAKLGGSLVINMGTVTPDGIDNYLLALQAYNLAGGPVIFDPVGAGATSVRRDAVKTLMAGGYFDLIKGNEGEIKTVAGVAGATQRGVDTGESTLDASGKGLLVRDLAARERTVVVMTGATDYISDGERTFAISNGHEYLGRITGSGCVLGTIMSAMLAVHREDKLVAAIAALLHYEIAAEIAAKQENVKGPGSFVPALIDELDHIRERSAKGDMGWLKMANIERFIVK
jgi:thiamine-phosphate diphosphorylase/hydroxyethylthiazole kinase